MTVLYVQTINDEIADFRTLCDLYRAYSHSSGDVELDFSYCGFLRQNAVAFLGGLARLAEKQGRKLTFRWQTLQNKIYTNLDQNGFASTFGYGTGPWHGNSIPYREYKDIDKNAIMNYLQKDWLGRGWVNVSSELRNAIVGTVWEIYANAFEHGRSEVGIISCGQHFRQLHELKLTVVDLGIGIPQQVRSYFGNPSINAPDAIRWAFQRGNSTKSGNSGPRGLGLDLLKDFVQVNRGRLEVFSHDGYARISDTDNIYQPVDFSLYGTMINIPLRCDETFYFLASENTQPLF